MRYRRSADVREAQLASLRSGRGHLVYLSGDVPSRTVYEDVAGNCLRPVFTLDWGRKETKAGRVIDVTRPRDGANFVERHVPCRKCANCLERRSKHWQARAWHEIKRSHRTWMATLTLSDDTVSRGLNVCRGSLLKQGLDFDALPPGERFAMLDGLMYREFQKRLKLLRKKVDVPFRYLAITEAHPTREKINGMAIPHWHVLFHETDSEKQFRYDEHWLGRFRVRCVGTKLRKWLRLRPPFWVGGLQDFDLCDPMKPWEGAYVCKYLSEAIEARVRASKRYGEGSGSPVPSKTEVNERRR